MSDHFLADDLARPARRFPRRVDRIAANRIPGLDMRTREGRVYRRAFNAALEEFPSADPTVIAKLARMRLLAEREEIAALSGRGSSSVAARIGDVAIRLARDIASRSADDHAEVAP
jgi:hypothetical protein